MRVAARCVSLIVATCSAVVGQATLNVPAQFPSIQIAIIAAANGDTVLVAPGIYAESIDFMGKPITVASAQGAAVTTIAGSPSLRVVTFTTGEGPLSVLDGFTVTGGDGGGGSSASMPRR